MKLLREPLLHFTLAGGLLFAIYGWLGRDSPDQRPMVQLTTGEVEWLVETWSRRWRRTPDEIEIQGLVSDYLREQLLATEARALGLDQNDTVITSRLAQKMRFLIDDTTATAEPTEQELMQLYEAGRASYLEPERVSFTQIFFKTQAAAQRGLIGLDTRAMESIGDPSLLEREHVGADFDAVTQIFGQTFTESLATLDAGRWHGPLRSTYGFHLVYLSSREPARVLPFYSVRERVLEDWRRAEQERAGQLLFAELLNKYELVVDEELRPLLDPSLHAHLQRSPE